MLSESLASSSIDASFFIGGNIRGSYATPLSQAIGTSIVLWLRTQVIQTTDTGTAGVGTGTLPVFVAAPQMALLSVLQLALTTSMLGKSLKGQYVLPLVAGIADGLLAHLSYVTVSSQHPGVGVGVGVGKFQGLSSAALDNLLRTFLVGAGINGTYAANLASAIAEAMVNFLNPVVFTIPIVGAPAPAAASGVGFGRLL